MNLSFRLFTTPEVVDAISRMTRRGRMLMRRYQTQAARANTAMSQEDARAWAVETHDIAEMIRIWDQCIDTTFVVMRMLFGHLCLPVPDGIGPITVQEHRKILQSMEWVVVTVMDSIEDIIDMQGEVLSLGLHVTTLRNQAMLQWEETERARVILTHDQRVTSCDSEQIYFRSLDMYTQTVEQFAEIRRQHWDKIGSAVRTCLQQYYDMLQHCHNDIHNPLVVMHRTPTVNQQLCGELVQYVNRRGRSYDRAVLLPTHINYRHIMIPSKDDSALEFVLSYYHDGINDRVCDRLTYHE